MPTRTQNVQFLRAVAAIFVVLFHTNDWQDFIFAKGSLAAEMLARMFVSVDLFFVISGFILWGYTRNNEGHSLYQIVDFSLGRLIRIFPTYWFWLTLWFVFTVAPGLDLSLAGIAKQYFLIDKHNWAIAWTLQYDMGFYILFAGVMGFARRKALWVMTSIVAALIACYFFFSVNHLFTRPIILEFLAGCWLAEWFRGDPKIRFAATASVVGLLCYPLLILWPEPFVAKWRFLFGGIPALLVTYGVVGLEWQERWRCGRIANYLGDMTYSIYLSHWVFLSIGGLIYFGLPESPALAMALVVALLLLYLPLNAVSYKYIEVKLGHWLRQKARQRLLPAIGLEKSSGPAESTAPAASIRVI